MRLWAEGRRDCHRHPRRTRMSPGSFRHSRRHNVAALPRLRTGRTREVHRSCRQCIPCIGAGQEVRSGHHVSMRHWPRSAWLGIAVPRSPPRRRRESPREEYQGRRFRKRRSVHRSRKGLRHRGRSHRPGDLGRCRIHHSLRVLQPRCRSRHHQVLAGHPALHSRTVSLKPKFH